MALRVAGGTARYAKRHVLHTWYNSYSTLHHNKQQSPVRSISAALDCLLYVEHQSNRSNLFPAKYSRQQTPPTTSAAAS